MVVLLGTVSHAGLRAQVVTPIEPGKTKPAISNAPIMLEDYKVEETEDDYDATGMGSVEEEMRDVPFSNDL
ncbi:MAG: hypothetical protein K9M98_15595, partial [Cephaloticoccus sp.]|nr:hypothetical protein [Cephaloticoccus sp.]